MLPHEKLNSLETRFSELEQALCDQEVLSDSSRYRSVTKERSDLSPLIELYRRYKETVKRLEEDKAALMDAELRELVLEEIPVLEQQLGELEEKIRVLLLPKDPNDERNTILEIRSGAGGEEAALFAADLFRMYARYAEQQGWKTEIMSMSEAAAGGIKEVIVLIKGDRVYSALRYEGGVHRVQRVPATEAQGRIHTSTATVAVLPEADEVDVEIREQDLEIATSSAGGPGGQGVNTTNSAVQLTHKPTGIFVRCQEQRSQIQNRARALQILRAKLLERERQVQADAISAERRGMVGTGDRAEKIRTYNFPQNRVTDHRIQLTVHNLDRVLEGELGELITAMQNHRNAELLQKEAH